MQLRVEAASLGDLPVLADINRLAFMRECTAQIAFPAWPDKDVMQKFFLASLEDDLRDPHTQVFKSVDEVASEHKIMGFVSLKLESGQDETPAAEKETKPSVSAKAIEEMAPNLNMPFVTAMGEASTALKSHKAGARHYCEIRIKSYHELVRVLIFYRPGWICRSSDKPGKGYRIEIAAALSECCR